MHRLAHSQTDRSEHRMLLAPFFSVGGGDINIKNTGFVLGDGCIFMTAGKFNRLH